MSVLSMVVWLLASLLVITAEMLFIEYHFINLPHTRAGIFFLGALRLLWGLLHLNLLRMDGPWGYLGGELTIVVLLIVMAATLDRKYGGNGLLCVGYLFGYEAIIMLAAGLLLGIAGRLFHFSEDRQQFCGVQSLPAAGGILLCILVAVCLTFPIGSLFYRVHRAGRRFLILLALLWESLYWGDVLYQTVNRYPYAVLAMCGVLLILYCLGDRIDKKKIRNENQMLSEMVQEQYEHYRQVQELREEIRRLRHDLANHMQVLRELKFSDSREYGQYEQELLQQVDRLKNVPITGNPVLDCVIGEKEKRCRENNIRFDWEIEDMQEVCIQNFDLVGLFSNLLDNAIEACLRTGRRDACVELHVKKKANYLVIKIYNTKLLKERMLGEKESILPYFTIKEDKNSHGLGLQIIQKIVKKYDGSFTWEDRGETFIGLVSLQCDIQDAQEEKGENEVLLQGGEKP